MISPSQDPQVKKRKLDELAARVRKKSREVRTFQSINESFGSDADECDENGNLLPCFGDDFIEDDGIQVVA